MSATATLRYLGSIPTYPLHFWSFSVHLFCELLASRSERFRAGVGPLGLQRIRAGAITQLLKDAVALAAGPDLFAGNPGRNSMSRQEEVIQSILIFIYGPMCDGRGTISRSSLEQSRRSGLWQLLQDRPALLYSPTISCLTWSCPFVLHTRAEPRSSSIVLRDGCISYGPKCLA